MTFPVFILGGAQTDFAKVWSRSGLDIADMMREVMTEALVDSKIEPRQVEAIHVGNAFAELQRRQAHLGAVAIDVMPEFWGIPAMRHEAACASSSIAILAAMAEIQSGRHQCILVVGAEEEKNTTGDIASENQNSAAWQGREDIDCRFMWPAAFGLMALEYESRYGLDRKHLNRIAEINYANARRNPLAQTRGWRLEPIKFTDDEIANPVIEAGTRRQDCAQITDGAAALILASPEFAAAHSNRLGINIEAFARLDGWGHRNAGARLKPKFEMSRNSELLFPHMKQAIVDAWTRAGVKEISMLDGIETHDCFTITEYLAIDHFGLTRPGHAFEAVESGAIERGGQLPFNPSGGLIGCGHPVGATGARLVLDSARQVTGRAGEMQVENAKRFGTLNIGGSCSTICSFVIASGT